GAVAADAAGGWTAGRPRRRIGRGSRPFILNEGQAMTTQRRSVLGVAGLALALGLLGPARQPASRAADDKPKAAKEEKDKERWKKLFDGKSLAGWKSAKFGAEGRVHVKGGAIVMEKGKQMTGVTYTDGGFP